jgi:hypothetical protein
MPSGKDPFEERLMRLGESGQTGSRKTAPAPLADAEPEQVQIRPRRRSGTSPVLLAFAFLFFLVSGGAFGVMLLAPELVFQSNLDILISEEPTH